MPTARHDARQLRPGSQLSTKSLDALDEPRLCPCPLPSRPHHLATGVVAPMRAFLDASHGHVTVLPA